MSQKKYKVAGENHLPAVKIKTELRVKVKLLKSITKIAAKERTSLRRKATIAIIIYLFIYLSIYLLYLFSYLFSYLFIFAEFKASGSNSIVIR